MKVLFLLYVNDLLSLLSLLVLLHADDVKTWRVIKKSEGDRFELENDLVKLSDWPKI